MALAIGLRDDMTETAEDYAGELAAMRARGLTMLCANPDLVVHRGERLVYCAGALAQAYEAMGGAVIYYGKPHLPVYESALAAAGRPAGACAKASAGGGRRAFDRHQGRQCRGAGGPVHRRWGSWRGDCALY